MQTKLKPIVVALALALAANSHTLWAGDEINAVAQDAKSSGETKAADDAAVTEMSPIQVRASSPEKTYKAPDATTATKMDVPVRDVPASIQTVTHELIQDQTGLGRLNDLGRNVSGVFIQEPGNGGSNTASMTFRGFSTNWFQLVDGVRRSSSGTSPDLAGIERVEFLKGPASVLYGNSGGSHGGLVNFITKKPTVTPIADVELTAGSYDFYRTALDVGRPLNEDKTVLFRMNAAAEKGNSFRDGIKHDAQYVAPTLAWSVDPNNSLLFQLEYTRNRYVNDYGWPVDPLVLNWPRNLTVGEPTYEGVTSSRTNGVVTFDHRFDEQWKLHLLGSYGDSPSHSCTVGSSINDPVNAPNIVSRYPGCGSGNSKEGDVQAELLGEIATGNIKHNVLIGLQYTPSRSSGSYEMGSTLPDLNVLNPLHGIAVTPPTGAGTYGNDSTAKAVYAQDLLTLAPGVKLLIGGREDHFSAQSYAMGAQTDDRQDAHFSPRAGLVYQPTTTTSLYASYSNSFSPNSYGRLRSGAVPPPEQGVQNEIGMKQDLLDGKANLNVALYQLTKRDALQCDPTDPTCTFVVTVGEQRSRGLEVDLGGDLTPKLRITTAATLMNAVVTKDLTLPVGTRFVGAPTRTFNIFGVYKFSHDESMNGFEIGGGYYYASEALGAYTGATNQFNLPPVKRIDVMGSYAFNPKTKIQVNVTNLTDRRNFLSNGFSPWPDQPRSIFATLRTKL